MLYGGRSGVSKPSSQTTRWIVRAATTGIDGEICYDPGPQQIAVNPGVATNLSKALNAYTFDGCVCWDNALLLKLLVLSTGIPARERFFYGGRTIGLADTFGEPSLPAEFRFGSFRTTAAVHDRASAQAHFTYHVQTLISGIYYDPSYGTVGRASSLHVTGQPSAMQDDARKC